MNERAELQKNIKKLYEEMFGLRPIHTLGGHIVHDPQIIEGGPFFEKFVRLSGLSEARVTGILDSFLSDYRSVSLQIEVHIQPDTKSSVDELRKYYIRLLEIRNKEENVYIFRFRSYEEFEGAT